MILDRILSHAETRPHAAALTDGERSISYAELRDLVTDGAGGARDSWRDTLAIPATPSLSTYVSILSTMAAGRAAMPLHPALPEVVVRQYEEDAAGLPCGPVLRLATSGTTGRPKLVGQHAAVYDAPEQQDLPAAFRTTGSRVLVAGPASSSGVLGWALLALSYGCTLHVLPEWSPAAYLAAMGAADAGLLSPALVRHIRSSGEPVVRRDGFTLVLGGAPVSGEERAWATLNLATHVWVVYGSTEGGLMATLPPWADMPERCVGFPARGSRFTVDGDELVFHPTWGGPVHTGDVGYVDERGRIFVVDRVDDMINVSGMKVWPSQIEAVLRRVPGVRDVCVVAAPDELRGQVPVALVVTDGAEPDLERAESRQLAPWQRPRRHVFVDSIPVSPAGKIQRGVIAASL